MRVSCGFGLAEVAGHEMRRLLHDTLGAEARQATVNAVFHSIRGTALSYQNNDALSGHGPAPETPTTNGVELDVLLAGLARAALLDPGTNA